MSTETEQANPRSHFPFRYGLRYLLLLVMIVAGAMAIWRIQEDKRLKLLRAEKQLVALSNQPRGWSFDPGALIRTTNFLHSLGENAALKALDNYAALHPLTGTDSDPPTDPMTLVVPLLFGFEKTNEVIVNDLSKRSFVFEGEVPFHRKTLFERGIPGARNELIRMAHSQGKLRSSQIVPTDDLFGAANKLIEKLRSEGVDADLKPGEWGVIQHVRAQTYKLVSHLVNPDKQDDSYYPEDDETWDRLESACARMKIYWGRRKQTYNARLPRLL